MERAAWLAQRRGVVMAEYDVEAPTYDAHEYPSDTQREWVRRLLARLAPGSSILDAPCGTGKYFPLVAAAGHHVSGIDQSSGMLEQARARGIAVSLERTSLQDMSAVACFDAVLTIDAMENVAPEDWPGVLSKLHRALRPGGPLYMTVEEVPDEDVAAAFVTLMGQGIPAVRGEVIEGDVAGYHYYPGRERVLGWFAAEGLEIVEEGYKQEGGGWGYRHFLLRKPASARR
jgi:cyclopropane fatty-acyl-phospholipid synthase-like methyltransferase